MGNDNRFLNNARKAKKDEFYTQEEDVARELDHYASQFAGKKVYLNCDTERSAFWKYFMSRFDELELTLLVATHLEPDGKSYKLERHVFDEEIVVTALDGDGDFRSPECVKLLMDSDVIITNPPFSLWREYFALLREKKTDFIVMGNMNAATYGSVLDAIVAGEVWMGHNTNKKAWFQVPQDYPMTGPGKEDGEGNKFLYVPGITWYTNLDFPERHHPLPLTEEYTPEAYPFYEGRDVIEVSRTKAIPCDYDGVMAVPVTFLSYFCPEQFRIIGAFRGGIVDGKKKYVQLMIEHIG